MGQFQPANSFTILWMLVRERKATRKAFSPFRFQLLTNRVIFRRKNRSKLMYCLWIMTTKTHKKIIKIINREHDFVAFSSRNCGRREAMFPKIIIYSPWIKDLETCEVQLLLLIYCVDYLRKEWPFSLQFVSIGLHLINSALIIVPILDCWDISAIWLRNVERVTVFILVAILKN